MLVFRTSNVLCMILVSHLIMFKTNHGWMVHGMDMYMICAFVLKLRAEGESGRGGLGF